MNYTIEIKKGEEFFIAVVKGLPGVFSQGKTEEEARENILDAITTFNTPLISSDFLGNGTAASQIVSIIYTFLNNNSS